MSLRTSELLVWKRSVAFQFDAPGTDVLEQNSIEGGHGTYDSDIVKERRVYLERAKKSADDNDRK